LNAGANVYISNSSCSTSYNGPYYATSLQDIQKAALTSTYIPSPSYSSTNCTNGPFYRSTASGYAVCNRYAPAQTLSAALFIPPATARSALITEVPEPVIRQHVLHPHMHNHQPWLELEALRRQRLHSRSILHNFRQPVIQRHAIRAAHAPMSIQPIHDTARLPTAPALSILLHHQPRRIAPKSPLPNARFSTLWMRITTTPLTQLIKTSSICGSVSCVIITAHRLIVIILRHHGHKGAKSSSGLLLKATILRSRPMLMSTAIYKLRFSGYFVFQDQPNVSSACPQAAAPRWEMPCGKANFILTTIRNLDPSATCRQKSINPDHRRRGYILMPQKRYQLKLRW